MSFMQIMPLVLALLKSPVPPAKSNENPLINKQPEETPSDLLAPNWPAFNNTPAFLSGIAAPSSTTGVSKSQLNSEQEALDYLQQTFKNGVSKHELQNLKDDGTLSGAGLDKVLEKFNVLTYGNIETTYKARFTLSAKDLEKASEGLAKGQSLDAYTKTIEEKPQNAALIKRLGKSFDEIIKEQQQHSLSVVGSDSYKNPFIAELIKHANVYGINAPSATTTETQESLP